MKTTTVFTFDDDSLNTLLTNQPAILNEISEELNSGVDGTSFDDITTFKVEQRLINRTISNSLNIGGFANGKSNITSFKVRYLVVLYSNKIDVLKDLEGNAIRKRYGIGVGFTLTVSEIKAKIGVDFRILAAASTLNNAKVICNLNIYGVQDAKLAASIPDGQVFDSEVFRKTQKFILAAKKELISTKNGRLFPIEILGQKYDQLETSDTRSIYFAVRCVSKGRKLIDAISDARNLKQNHLRINENIIFFIYNYFNLSSAYVEPSEDQKQNARRWITGRYNKVKKSAISESKWVSVDPMMNGERFLALDHLPDRDFYVPHKKPQNWAKEPKRMDVLSSTVSLDFSSSVELASMMSTSGRFNSLVIVKDFALFSDIAIGASPNSRIIETRYGISLRLVLRVFDLEFGTEINFKTVGAACELGHAKVEYEIHGIGISDPKILLDLPGPQNITHDSIEEIQQSLGRVIKKIAQMDGDQFDPQPLSIRVNEPEKVDPTLEAQATVFSIDKIANRVRLEDAIQEGQLLGINVDCIKKVYTEDYKILNGDRPSPSSKREARDWLIFEE